jgi:hypothetical protein
MWKERLWQVFLVGILGLSLTMCSRSSSNNSTSADGTTTVNVGPSAISHTMLCEGKNWINSSGAITFNGCDASDDTLTGTSITHDAAFATGWKLVGTAGFSGGNYLFHK